MEPPSCRIDCLNPSGFPVSLRHLARAIEAAFDLYGRNAAQACLLLTGDDEIQDLNRRFRSVDAATDVLTFPSEERIVLGDIAISVPYAARQAAERNVPLDTELAYLAIHGALHLLGFDDETEPERAAMVDRMNDVARSIGLPADEEWSSLLHAEAL